MTCSADDRKPLGATKTHPLSQNEQSPWSESADTGEFRVLAPRSVGNKSMPVQIAAASTTRSVSETHGPKATDVPGPDAQSCDLGVSRCDGPSPTGVYSLKSVGPRGFSCAAAFSAAASFLPLVTVRFGFGDGWPGRSSNATTLIPRW